MQARDRASVSAFIRSLDTDSLYERFRGVPDGRRIRMLCGEDSVVAEDYPDGTIAGHAMAVPYAAPGGPVAEIAVVVAARWRRQGLGSLLLNAAARHARDGGAATLAAWIPVSGRHLVTMFARLGTGLRLADDGHGELYAEVTVAGAVPPAREFRVPGEPPGRTAPPAGTRPAPGAWPCCGQARASGHGPAAVPPPRHAGRESAVT